MAEGDGAVEVVPVRHVGRWVGMVAAVVVVAMVVHTLLSKIPTGSPVCRVAQGVRSCHRPSHWRFDWNIVGQYFTTREVLDGLNRTLELTVLAMVIGIVLGVIVAIMRLSKSRLLVSTAWTYTWFFRGTPVLVQLLFWFVIATIYPHLTIGVPFLSVTFLHINTVTLFSPFTAAVVGLGLNEAAYMSEIARAGILSVDEGQVEAASSLGMSRGKSLRLVILPQAMRVILPPTGNEVISMLKTTSLASEIGVIELLGAVTNISAVNYDVVPLLIVASLWYLIVTTVLSIGQFYLERHFSKGALRTPPPTPIQRIRQDLRGIRAKMRPRAGVFTRGASL
ncbi:MAG TPA: amino acid ABC transporter permease [Acidimicrobiales bacterium]|nr:amino acid ABC transporter permease [Acidimicrobiales bacterium]